MDAAHLQRFLSDSSRQATRSEIRELLKLIARPEIISLAGGLPSPEVFPLDELATLLPVALEREGAQALQYGPTEGDTKLRKELLRLMVELEGEAFERLTLENILITSASQQGLDLCSRVFISPGDAVICGLPSYLGALGAFTACGARLSGIPLDDEGMRTDLLEQRLVRLRAQDVHPKFIYTVPDFQNPSGVTYTRARREDLLAIAREFDVLVVEDSPYRQLRYVGEPLPTLAELDRDGRVISLFTLSKMLSPGLRLGWAVADPQIIARLVVAKQPVDLCTSGLTQLATHEYLKTGHLDAQLERARGIYAKRREAMLAALDRHLDPAWGARWNRPEGGFFVWMTLPEGVDGAVLLKQALREKVAFVTGSAFHCDGSGRNTIRLNFSFPEVDKLEIAVERLSRCIRKMADEATEPAAPATEPEMLVAGDHALEQLAWNLILSRVVE
jgi:2-aminoadipate transaminase